MGNRSTKSKKRLKKLTQQSNECNGSQNYTQEDSNVTSDDTDRSDDYIESSPVVKWHKANPKEEIIKIQQAAEIKDIEAIYGDSCAREADLLNHMPDHFWVGRENKLPRYVEYRGHSELASQMGNLKRMKSSSLGNLSESFYLNHKFEPESPTDVNTTRKSFRSVSCPQINFLVPSLSKEDKSVPKKGILKKRLPSRPVSAMISNILENGNNTVVNSEHVRKRSIINEEGSHDQLESKYFKNELDCKGDSFGQTADYCDTNLASDLPLSGYFDISTNERQQNDSFQMLRVNLNKKLLIKNNLDKKLNLRPSSIELTDRNILHAQTETDRQCDLEQTRSLLSEKLSVRPSVTELKTKKIIKFNDFIEVKETDNYDRSVNKTWVRLTDQDRVNIRVELNEFKEKEMQIHSKSKIYTKFHDF